MFFEMFCRQLGALFSLRLCLTLTVVALFWLVPRLFRRVFFEALGLYRH